MTDIVTLFFRPKVVKVNGIAYKPLCTVLLGVENDDPIFIQVEAIYIVETNKILLHVQVMRKVDYKVHFHVHVIEASDVLKPCCWTCCIAHFLCTFVNLPLVTMCV